MVKSSVFKARLKVVTVLVDRQLCGSEFHTGCLSHNRNCMLSFCEIRPGTPFWGGASHP